MESPWILTASGRKYHYLANDPTEFHVPDIAAALSRMCRYSGHLSDKYDNDIYSVAQHSVYVYWLLLKVEAPTRVLPWAIAHDMPEAYWTDVPSPLKSLLPEYKELEHGSAELMREYMGIPYDEEIEKYVKWADIQILYSESQEITSIPSELWDCGETAQYTLQEIDEDFHLWRPRKARDVFTEQFNEAMKYAHNSGGVQYANAS